MARKLDTYAKFRIGDVVRTIGTLRLIPKGMTGTVTSAFTSYVGRGPAIIVTWNRDHCDANVPSEWIFYVDIEEHLLEKLYRRRHNALGVQNSPG